MKKGKYEMMEKKILGVRKGAWTKEEDVLLRKCIQKYGEGRWHLVPVRAGLNRCRKSCRLRWLNYLRPNIKRGYFVKEEVDLIVRLQKLLGNRWSLIAGRIPGRTANDVKNFWNTHMDKKSTPPPPTSAIDNNCRLKPAGIIQSKIIRPRPLTFSPKLQQMVQMSKSSPPTDDILHPTKDKNENPKNGTGSFNPTTSPLMPENKNPQIEPLFRPLLEEEEAEEDECVRWWGSLLDITENGNGAPLLFTDEGHNPVMLSTGLFSQADEEAVEEHESRSWGLDVDVWDLACVDN